MVLPNHHRRISPHWCRWISLPAVRGGSSSPAALKSTALVDAICSYPASVHQGTLVEGKLARIVSPRIAVVVAEHQAAVSRIKRSAALQLPTPPPKSCMCSRKQGEVPAAPIPDPGEPPPAARNRQFKLYARITAPVFWQVCDYHI